jgi:hypothetical protein
MKVQRPGRLVAVVGAVAAVSATSMLAIVGGASAAEPGRCVETVNVREKPDINAPIVAVCEAGTDVMTGQTRNGFVKLDDLDGWAAQQYISINGANPVVPTATDDETDAESGTDDAADESTGDTPAQPAADPSPLRLLGRLL